MTQSVFQGKPPSDDHLIKLCGDILRSECLTLFKVTVENGTSGAGSLFYF